MPKNMKIKLPASAKLLNTRKQVHAARRAILRRRGCSESAVMARNDGMAANGSTRKKMELNATNENWSNELKESCMGIKLSAVSNQQRISLHVTTAIADTFIRFNFL
jgi:hypothetical protein